MFENVKIRRNQGTLIVPKDVWKKIQSEGMYITIRTIKRSYGNYYEPWVTKAVGTNRVRTTLARYILKPDKKYHTDHIDRNPLNNCRSNLRICTPSFNGANRKKGKGTLFKYKGIGIKGKSYYAVIRFTVNKKQYQLSATPFKTQKKAALAYDELARFVFGEYASTNFSESKTRLLSQVIK